MRRLHKFGLWSVLWAAALQGQSIAPQMASGAAHGVLLKSDGAVWTWGGNPYGQLGRDSDDSWAPAPVPGLSNIREVAAGAEFTLALEAGGAVWAWGQDEDGQLGSPDIPRSQKPVAVRGLPSIAAIAAAGNHALALDADGKVWEWGDVPAGHRSPTPAQRTNLPRIAAIAAGDRHSIALDADGHVWVWGDSGADLSSSPGQLPGLSDVVAVAGAYQLTVALKKDGAVWSVGYGAAGQRGNGASETSSQPVMAAGLTGVKAIAARYMNVIALKSDGTVWNWGSNHFRQLGNPAFREDDENKPVRAGTLAGVVAIATGGSHSVGVTKDGTIWTWGENDRGALGGDPDALTQSDAPMQPGQKIPPPCTELFSCQTASGKPIRICGTQNESDVGKWTAIHYRFGPENGPPELLFPADPGNAPPSLFYAEEKRGRDSVGAVRFTNGAYTYTVYFGDADAGVDVKDAKGGKVASIACTERPEVYGDYLRDNLPCDPKTPRACKPAK